ncbi:hypothetical protein ATE69_17575 [Sphingopyxis sp. H071]|nr:hypothetical protein ATE61_15885 [Sphingopyxis sp. H057]KTE50167.1 hypothetical protein ATE64_17095 [Sphingopyxis sp. H073]KTE50557.1 hypothetical protein ATE69_17575 [Sphingopyxis sp. H071]KTE59842.1 hypothetical protein ATE66_09595 [Sphingopyxis sp. H107]KTE63625.1 hypothetical protein ATE65_14280 [Sphingopyxis sp. H100]KTE71716.1 hypothetical protein ATE60_12720 [Sphingopyxis sp. H081]KTE82473.1 hypothetical protein ATE63_00050 [Sphingopyxis sp. H067]
MQYDDRVGVHCRHGFDQLILTLRKIEVGHVGAFPAPLIGEDDGDIGSARSFNRVSNVTAVPKDELGCGCPGLQRLERNGTMIGLRKEACEWSAPANGHRNRRPLDALHLRRSRARQHAAIRITADDRDLLGGRGQWQRICSVVEQDDAFFRHCFGNLSVGLEVDGLDDRRVLVEPIGINAIKHAPVHVLDPRGQPRFACRSCGKFGAEE